MIETRNATNTMVLSRSGVNIWNVSDKLVDKVSFDEIQRMFPVTEEEIFAIIDCVADVKNKIVDGDIEFIDVGEENSISLETTHLSEGVYFNIINYGRIYYPNETILDLLYNKGLSFILIDIYTDIKHDSTRYMDSELHYAIFKAVGRCVGPIKDPEVVLRGLPVEEYDGLQIT
jgi:hypothetical protein